MAISRIKMTMTLLASTWPMMVIAAPNAGDPWSINTVHDKMSDQASTKAWIALRADDGHSFEITADCSPVLSTIGLEVLLGGGAKYRINENTTTTGSPLFGYHSNTSSQVSLRMRFDQQPPLTGGADATYNNVFVLSFPNREKVKHNFENRARGGPTANAPNGGMSNLALGFLEMGMMFGGNGDALQLLDSRVLLLQPALANGDTPIVEIPLSQAFKNFVARCAVPERTPEGLAAAEQAKVQAEAAAARAEARARAAAQAQADAKARAAAAFANGTEASLVHGTYLDDTLRLDFIDNTVRTQTSAGVKTYNYAVKKGMIHIDVSGKDVTLRIIDENQLARPNNGTILSRPGS